MLELSPVLTIVEATSARKIPVQCNPPATETMGMSWAATKFHRVEFSRRDGTRLRKWAPPVRHYIATVFSLQRRPDVCARFSDRGREVDVAMVRLFGVHTRFHVVKLSCMACVLDLLPRNSTGWNFQGVTEPA